MRKIDNLFEAVMTNLSKFTFPIYKTGPPFLSQSRKLEDPLSILIKTISFISFSQTWWQFTCNSYSLQNWRKFEVMKGRCLSDSESDDLRYSIFRPNVILYQLIQAHADEAGDAKRRLERTEELVRELKSQNTILVAKLDQILGKLGTGWKLKLEWRMVCLLLNQSLPLGPVFLFHWPLLLWTSNF